MAKTKSHFYFDAEKYLSDERFELLTVEAEGLYFRLLSFFHKAESYGIIKTNPVFSFINKNKIAELADDNQLKEVFDYLKIEPKVFFDVAFWICSIIKKVDTAKIAPLLIELIGVGVLQYKNGQICCQQMIDDFHKNENKAFVKKEYWDKKKQEVTPPKAEMKKDTKRSSFDHYWERWRDYKKNKLNGFYPVETEQQELNDLMRKAESNEGKAIQLIQEVINNRGAGFTNSQQPFFKSRGSPPVIQLQKYNIN